MLCAFDLTELDGEDLQRSTIEVLQAQAKLLRRPELGIALNEHYGGDGEIIFKHACKLGCDGIVSKRLGSLYRSGLAALDQGQKPERARREAGGRGGLEPLILEVQEILF